MGKAGWLEAGGAWGSRGGTHGGAGSGAERAGASAGSRAGRSNQQLAAAGRSTHLCSRGPACRRRPPPRSAHRRWAAPQQSASWLQTAQPQAGWPTPPPHAPAAAGAGRPARRTAPPGSAPCRWEAARRPGGLSRQRQRRAVAAVAAPHPQARAHAGPASTGRLLTRRRRCEHGRPAGPSESPSRSSASVPLLTAPLPLLG